MDVDKLSSDMSHAGDLADVAGPVEILEPGIAVQSRLARRAIDRPLVSAILSGHYPSLPMRGSAGRPYGYLVTTGEDGFKSMNYVGMVAPLVEALKAQQTQIKALEARIEQLEQ